MKKQPLDVTWPCNQLPRSVAGSWGSRKTPLESKGFSKQPVGVYQTLPSHLASLPSHLTSCLIVRVSLMDQLCAALILSPPFPSQQSFLSFCFFDFKAFSKNIGLSGLWCSVSSQHRGSWESLGNRLHFFTSQFCLLPNLLYPSTLVLPFSPVCLLCWPSTMQ